MNTFIKTVLVFAVFAAVGCGGNNTPDKNEKVKERKKTKK